MNIIDLIEEIGLVPKKKTLTHGGEYCSPCPFCKDGKDRFLIWPHRNNKNGEYKGGRFSCRVCSKYGDAIKFIRELHGLSYKDACQKLKIEPKQRNERRRVVIKHTPQISKDPATLWCHNANSFVNLSHDRLMKNSNALDSVKSRGFSIDSIVRFKIGFNSQDIWTDREGWGLEKQIKEDGTLKKHWLPSGIVIPTFSDDQIIKVKVRRSNWKEDDNLPKYVEISGSKQCPSVFGDIGLPAFIIESELDALLVQQEASDLVYCIALGGSTKQIDFHTDQLLCKASNILFCPDFDKAGKLAWDKWKKMFPTIQRILTPDGKSAGDAYLAGVDLREWIIATLETIQEG